MTPYNGFLSKVPVKLLMVLLIKFLQLRFCKSFNPLSPKMSYIPAQLNLVRWSVKKKKKSQCF